MREDRTNNSDTGILYISPIVVLFLVYFITGFYAVLIAIFAIFSALLVIKFLIIPSGDRGGGAG